MPKLWICLSQRKKNNAATTCQNNPTPRFTSYSRPTSFRPPTSPYPFFLFAFHGHHYFRHIVARRGDPFFCFPPFPFSTLTLILFYCFRISLTPFSWLRRFLGLGHHHHVFSSSVLSSVHASFLVITPFHSCTSLRTIPQRLFLSLFHVSVLLLFTPIHWLFFFPFLLWILIFFYLLFLFDFVIPPALRTFCDRHQPLRIFRPSHIL